MAEQEIGKISHYYNHLEVGIIDLTAPLKVGDTIRIKGNTVDCTQQVSSMRIEFTDVTEAKAGDLIGVKVEQKVHEEDSVFKVLS